MSLFFESIRVVNGRVMNLTYHQQRVNRCCDFLGINYVQLKKAFDKNPPPLSHIYKARLSISIHGEISLDYSLYNEKAINTLKLIPFEGTYAHKWEDRGILDSAFAKREKNDDILLVKDGMITDSWYCNVAFYNGEKWLTPKVPLLAGTMRQKLIDRSIIIPSLIHVNDLGKFSKLRLFNAMIPWSKKKETPISAIAR